MRNFKLHFFCQLHPICQLGKENLRVNITSPTSELKIPLSDSWKSLQIKFLEKTMAKLLTPKQEQKINSCQPGSVALIDHFPVLLKGYIKF